MSWHVITKNDLYFSGWTFRGNKPPFERWSSFCLVAEKFHAANNKRIDELRPLAKVMGGELVQIPDPPIDMTAKTWYNGGVGMAAHLESQSEKHNRRPTFTGATAPFATKQRGSSPDAPFAFSDCGKGPFSP